eukprot:766454-Hanusia_phi.AAC.8
MNMLRLFRTSSSSSRLHIKNRLQGVSKMMLSSTFGGVGEAGGRGAESGRGGEEGGHKGEGKPAGAGRKLSNLKAVIQYDGTGFSGFQRQNHFSNAMNVGSNGIAQPPPRTVQVTSLMMD